MRLTDRKTAADLKANAESLRALGFEPSILDQRYIKLAEYEDAEELIKPTTDVEPVKYAKWEICSDGYYPYCSNCKNEPQGGVMTPFCPNCGTKMDGD